METVVSCKLRLHPTPEQGERLLASARAYRDALNYMWKENFEGDKTSAMRRIHDEFYHVTREQFGIPAQYAIDLNRETRATFSTLWALQKKEFKKPSGKRRDHFRHAPIRKSLAVQLSMNRSVSVFPQSRTAHVTVLDGRVKDIPISGFHRHLEIMSVGKMGDPKLMFDERTKHFYLIVPVTIEVEETKPIEVVAIDVGERHIAAVVSTAGRREVVDLPKHYAPIKTKIHRLRGRLQSKGTRSARRHLKSLRRRERLFTSDCLHVLSKEIVTQHAQSVIVMEDLTDIRDNRNTHRGRDGEARRRAEQWPFREFQQKIVHKHGLLNGRNVVFLDPAFTSQTCPRCGYVSSGNRVKDEFRCLECGHSDHADLVAGDNLLSLFERAAVNRPEGASGPGDAPREIGSSK